MIITEAGIIGRVLSNNDLAAGGHLALSLRSSNAVVDYSVGTVGTCLGYGFPGGPLTRRVLGGIVVVSQSRSLDTVPFDGARLLYSNYTVIH